MSDYPNADELWRRYDEAKAERDEAERKRNLEGEQWKYALAQAEAERDRLQKDLDGMRGEVERQVELRRGERAENDRLQAELSEARGEAEGWKAAYVGDDAILMDYMDYRAALEEIERECDHCRPVAREALGRR